MEFDFRILTLNDFNMLSELINEIYEKMPRKEFWGGLSDEEIHLFLTKPNYILGAFYNDELVAFMCSYKPEKSDFNHYEMDENPLEYEFLHGVMVKNEFRGNSLQYKLGKHIIDNSSRKYILATVHPENMASLKSLTNLGLKIIKTLDVGYGYRHVMILEK